jgi:hypothetical protein
LARLAMACGRYLEGTSMILLGIILLLIGSLAKIAIHSASSRSWSG